MILILRQACFDVNEQNFSYFDFYGNVNEVLEILPQKKLFFNQKRKKVSRLQTFHALIECLRHFIVS